MRRKYYYHPPKEPCIYFLEIYLDNKWHILYIGETEKLTQRLYNHVKEKKDWGIKGKSRYFSIPAPKDRKVRKYFEAYLVVKFQPLLQQGLKMKNVHEQNSYQFCFYTLSCTAFLCWTGISMKIKQKKR